MTFLTELLASNVWLNLLLFLSFLYACWQLLIRRLPVPPSSSIDESTTAPKYPRISSPPHKLVNSSSVDDLDLTFLSASGIDENRSGAATVAYFEDLVGKLWKKQKRKRRSLVGKTFSAAVNKIRERQQYNKVTKQTIHGDGLKSIFAEYSAKDAMQEEGDAHGNGQSDAVEHGFMASPGKIPRNLSSFSEYAELYTLLRANDIYAWMPDPVLRSLSKLVGYCLIVYCK